MGSQNETNDCTDTKAGPTTHFAIGIVAKVRGDDGKGNSLEGDQYEKTERSNNVASLSTSDAADYLICVDLVALITTQYTSG